MNALQAMRQVHGALPTDYVCLDCETICVDRKQLPVTCTVVVVRNKQQQQSHQIAIDWTSEGLSRDVVAAAVRQTNLVLSYPHNREIVSVDRVLGGVSLPAAADWWLSVVGSDPIVAHNLLRADAAWISPHITATRPYAANPFSCNQLCDTGMLEVALRVPVAPAWEETWSTWQHRIGQYRMKVKWSLSVCAERYDLYRKTGLAVDNHHEDLADCVMCQSLFETYRQLSEQD